MKKPTALLAVIVLLAVAASFPLTATGTSEKSAAAAKLEVTYYYLPG